MKIHFVTIATLELSGDFPFEWQAASFAKRCSDESDSAFAGPAGTANISFLRFDAFAFTNLADRRINEVQRGVDPGFYFWINSHAGAGIAFFFPASKGREGPQRE